MTRVRWAGTACAAMTTLAVAHAAPITFDAALKRAEDTAPALLARSADVRAARSAAIAAGRLPDPKLTFGVDGFPISGPNFGHPERDDFSDVRIGVMQDVTSGAKRRAARERATADIGAAEVGRSAQARAVRLATALAWIDLYYAQRRLAALDEVARALETLRRAAPAQMASGALRPAQTVEPEQMIAALGDRRADLVAAMARARSALVRWTGDADVAILGVPDDYAVDPVALRAGIDALPTLTAFDAMARQADAEVDGARADKRPDWSWELAYQHRAPRFGDMVMVQATVSLPLFGSTRQDPVIAARALSAGRVRIEREAARRELLAGLESDLADHFMHHDRLDRAMNALVPLARKRVALETASYAAGTATLTDALSAYAGLAQALTDTLDRQADVARDAARLVLTYGVDAQ